MVLTLHYISFAILTDKDWEDIKFGVDNQIDYYAVSFVKDAKVVIELKDYLKRKAFDHHFLHGCHSFSNLFDFFTGL